MFINSLLKVLNNTYENLNYARYEKVDPNLVRYFRTEYGANWEYELEHYIYKKNLKNNKKAA